MQALNNYWKCEYENLRRKNIKAITKIESQKTNFYDKTYKLLFEILNLDSKKVMEYYQTGKWN